MEYKGVSIYTDPYLRDDNVLVGLNGREIESYFSNVPRGEFILVSEEVAHTLEVMIRDKTIEGILNGK